MQRSDKNLPFWKNLEVLPEIFLGSEAVFQVSQVISFHYT